MYRYLLNISYIGTSFRGIQKTVNKLEEVPVDTRTIQGSIELALRGCRPVNEIRTVLSSRTDAGVHALHSTLHVDLHRKNSEPYETTLITSVLNRTLYKHGLPIRVLSTQIVPDTFHCRYNAKARTYLYRIAVSRICTSESSWRNKGYESYIPVEEIDRCLFIHDPQFNIDIFRDASRFFLGKHDFRTFMSTSREHSLSRDNPMFTVRYIAGINIEPGKSLALKDNSICSEELYKYWDIEITGKSFLYKQVRRIVGTLISAATKNIDEKCICEMLTVPSKYSWNPRIQLAPAFGLYLRKVHYDDKDLNLIN